MPTIDKYFDKFPIITYSNNSVIDITKRVGILEQVSRNPYVFYPYDITSNERADQLSYRYYTDPFKSWLVYLTNKITDPYYEWYMQTDELNGLIEKKYGSLELAQTKIKYYKNDYLNKDSISVARYNSLTAGEKGYWEPVYGATNQILEYIRKQEDWIVNTNKIYSYTVSSNTYVVDEICNIVFDANNIGKGQVVSISNNTLILQHLSGTFKTDDTVSILPSSYIFGTESESNSIFTTAQSLANNISADEEIYWSGVTYYDYEYNRNEYNKSVRVLDNRFSQQAVKDLKNLMKE